MERQTFVLLQKKTYRHTVRLWLKSDNAKSKIDQRNIKFTTENKVSEKKRNTTARGIAAEFSTSDQKVINGLFHDSGYGKTFVHKDDPKGLRKLEAFKVTPLDAEKTALSNLFENAEIPFDGEKDVKVLRAEYNIHMAAVTGVVLQKGNAKEIAHDQVDIQKDMMNQAESARKAYEEKYDEEIPVEYSNDLGLLSAILADPDFDAKGYMDEQSESVEKEDEEIEHPVTLGELQADYFEKFGKNVANLKKNDAAWIKEQLAK